MLGRFVSLRQPATCGRDSTATATLNSVPASSLRAGPGWLVCLSICVWLLMVHGGSSIKGARGQTRFHDPALQATVRSERSLYGDWRSFGDDINDSGAAAEDACVHCVCPILRGSPPLVGISSGRWGEVEGAAPIEGALFSLRLSIIFVLLTPVGRE